MSTDLLTAREGDELLDTLKRMKHGGVRRVPVVDEAGTLVGILALEDLIELVGEQLMDLVGLLNAELRHERERRGT
jgi:CBS domain-containing protein